MRLGSKSARSECGERKRQWRVSHAQQCGEGIAPVVRSLLFAGVLGAAITLVGMEGSESSSSMRSPNLQCGEGETSECVMACTVSATRFSTPTLRINLATCALTVRSPMPSGVHFIEMASAER